MNGLEEKYKGKVETKKVNASSEYELSNDFEIQYVPTFVFLDSTGATVDKIVGTNTSDIEKRYILLSGSH